MADESLNFKFSLDLSDFDKAPDKIASALASIKVDAEKEGKNVDLAMSGFLQSLIKEREEAIAKLSQELEKATKDVAVAFANMEAGVTGADKEYDKAWESMDKLQNSIAQTKKELELLDEKQFEVASDASFMNQLRMVTQQMDVYGKIMTLLPAPIANVVKSTKLLDGTLKVLSTNPIVMMLAGLALAIKGLYGWFDGLADRSDGVAYAFGVVSGAVDKAISAFNELIHLNVEGFLYNIKTMFDGGEREVAKRNEDLRRVEEQGLRDRLQRDNQFLRRRMNNTKLDMKDRLDAEKQYTENLKKIEETRRAELDRKMTEWSKKNGLRTKDNPNGWATDISQLSGPLQVELQEMYNEMARIDNAIGDITEESKDRLVKMNEEALAEVRKQAEFRRKVKESIQEETRQLEAYGRQRDNFAMQNIINDMADGIEKSSKQAELKMKQSLDSLNDAIYAEAKRLYQRERELYEGNPKNEGKMFKMFELSQYEAQARANIGASEQEKGINATYVRVVDKLYENQIKKFQTYEDRRIEIERQASETRLAFEKKGLRDSEQAQLAELDRLKKLFAIDLEEWQSGGFVQTALGNISALSKESLAMLQKELDDFTMKEAVKDMLDEETIKQLDELQEQIEDAKVPYMSLKDAINDVKNAQVALNEARQTQDAKKILDAENKLAKAMDNARDKYDKTIQAVCRLTDAVAGLGYEIGGVVGEIMQLLPSVVGVVSSVGEGVKTVQTETVAALKAIEVASVILEIISLVVQLGHAIASLFGDEENERKAREHRQLMRDIYGDMEDAVYKYKQALIEAKYAEEDMWSGTNTSQMLKAMEQRDEAFGRLKDKQEELYKMTAENFGVIMALPENLKDVKALNGNGIKIGNTNTIMTSKYNAMRVGGARLLTGVLKERGMDQLFDENGNFNLTAYKALKEVSDIYENINDKAKDELEAIAQVAEDYKNFQENLAQGMADWYAPILDNMTDAWMNWLDTGEDVMDSFKDYSAETFRTIVKDLLKTQLYDNLFSQYKDDINKYTEEYLKDNNVDDYAKKVGEATDAVMKNLGDDKFKQLLETWDKTLEQYDIDINGAESGAGRSAEARGIARASQESVDENNARLAMMQQHTYTINANVAQLVSYSASALEHLSAIHSNTNRLERIEGILSNIESYGVRSR